MYAEMRWDGSCPGCRNAAPIPRCQRCPYRTSERTGCQSHRENERIGSHPDLNGQSRAATGRLAERVAVRIGHLRVVT